MKMSKQEIETIVERGASILSQIDYLWFKRVSIKQESFLNISLEKSILEQLYGRSPFGELTLVALYGKPVDLVKCGFVLPDYFPDHNLLLKHFHTRLIPDELYPYMSYLFYLHLTWQHYIWQSKNLYEADKQTR